MRGFFVTLNISVYRRPGEETTSQLHAGVEVETERRSVFIAACLWALRRY